MTALEAIKKVHGSGSVHLVRARKDEPKQYDVKEWQGNKRGWVALDITTAGVCMSIYNALGAEAKAKFETLPLTRVIDVCWKLFNKHGQLV